jgi:hypothetical protein
MHRMPNLNKFKDSYQVLDKNLRLSYMSKKKFKDSWGISKQLFLAQEFYHKHLIY